MTRRYPMLLAAALAVTLALPTFAMAAADKETEKNEKPWSALGPNQVLADVAEVEPNGSLATAQLLDCGNTLRPAFMTPARDTDYVKFTATAGTIITVGTDADGTTGQIGDTRIRLFNASGAVLASDDDSGPGLYSLLTFTATYTGTYYVGFAAFGTTTSGQYKGFITCAAPTPPPVNDICAGALPIECGNINVSGTTAFANNDYTPLASGTGGCTGFPAVGKDVVYVINAAGSDAISLSYTSSAADGAIYLITNCGSPGTSCVAGADATLTGAAETLNYTFPTSGIYYLVLDNYGTGAGGAFTLTGTMTCHVVPANRKTWGALKSYYR
ncbi:MAG: PPC domain-containing protein [Candidatus Eisenbacteria bacterium]|uniref:PPC domain-containing protein n=1 Tax=Eiseniibacteriota bacterium TaxID=2212470 RepID=A0A933W0Z2_UNCEI|nr:PPC domain-containing protein [Candidatus Eisenbacteria bacterium]